MKHHFPTLLLVDTPYGLIPFDSGRAGTVLPGGPDGENPPILYGPYFEALLRFIEKDSFEPLVSSLREHLGRTVHPDAIRQLDIISEKHGALYHVAHLRIHLQNEICSLALNTAASPAQKASMTSELAVLEELRHRFDLPFLPRSYYCGNVPYRDRNRSGPETLSLFLSEWFEDHHEFHLSRIEGQQTPILKVWAPQYTPQNLTTAESHTLYAKAAHILTSYLDPSDFRQIYPWHHAAGDFVIQRQGGSLDVRMVTARGYGKLLTVEEGFDAKWIGPVHFFLNLTIRMRLDRYDGTGELAWADTNCIGAVTAGFLEAWATKAERCHFLTSGAEMHALLRAFDEDEWFALSEIVLEDCMIEQGEIPFLQSRMKEHVSSLCAVLAKE